MAAKPLRLLHAANLRLDCPLRQFGTWYDDIRDIIDSATLTAYERLIGLAIERDVDALMITGNSFDAATASLSAEVALRAGLERLHDRSIPVFITPGTIDPLSAWEDLPSLPDNVTIMAHPNDTPVDLMDHGRVLATLVPVNVDSSVEPHELENLFEARAAHASGRPFVVGLALPHQGHSRPVGAARYTALDWLACAAADDSATHLPLTDGTINAQNGPQGLTIDECGPQGATLLEVDSHHDVKQTHVPLSPVRWERITQSMDRVTSRDNALERMLMAVERLTPYPGELLRIIHWKLERTSGETHGWELDSAIDELTTAMTELTDQPDGLRYIHQIQPLDPDLSLIESAHREVLTEFLLALNRRAPVERPAIRKWLADAHFGDVLKSTRWEHWPESVEPARIAERAQQMGWQWFATFGKK